MSGGHLHGLSIVISDNKSRPNPGCKRCVAVLVVVVVTAPAVACI